MSLTLTVSHSLFLTRDQCYSIHNGNEVEIIGVSIPTWFYKGKISEPTIEVFCRYKINQTKNLLSIKEKSKIYELSIPIINSENITTKNLLDIKDDGSEHIIFRQYQSINRQGKLEVRHGMTYGQINMLHFIEIKRIEDLLATLS